MVVTRFRRVLGILASDRLLLLLAAMLAILILVDPGDVAKTLYSRRNMDSVLFLASMIMASRSLEASGILDEAAGRVASLTGDPRLQLVLLEFMTAAASAVVMNDASLFVFIPIATALAERTGMERDVPVVTTILAANAGSSLTPIGNPQNLYVWRFYDVPAYVFIRVQAPLVCIALLFTTLMTLASYRGAPKGGPVSRGSRVDVREALLASLMILVIVLGGELGFTLPVFVFVAILYLARLRGGVGQGFKLTVVFTLMLIDFSSLSMVLKPIVSGWSLAGFKAILIGAALSQAVSNVPATVLLANITRDWRHVIIGTNLGGLGLLPGSLANIIGVRLGGIDSSAYHKYALPVFLSTLVAVSLLALGGIYP